MAVNRVLTKEEVLPFIRAWMEPVIQKAAEKMAAYNGSFWEQLDDYGLVALEIALRDKQDKIKACVLRGDPLSADGETVIDACKDKIGFCIQYLGYIACGGKLPTHALPEAKHLQLLQRCPTCGGMGARIGELHDWGYDLVCATCGQLAEHHPWPTGPTEKSHAGERGS